MLSLDERLTDEELRLLAAVRRECRRRGDARSLFQVGVVLAGLDYKDAWKALDHLENVERVVDVIRLTGCPLIMKDVT